MKIRKLQLAARFALCKFFHDSGILFVELIQQADDQDADKDQQRAKHMSWFDFLDDITEPELIQYLKERRLYVNEPVNTSEEE